MVNSTTGMANFPKLGDDEFRLADREVGADFETGQIESLSGNVFGKISGNYIETFGTHGIDTFLSKKTHLAVPFTGMSIVFQSEISDKVSGLDVFLAYTFAVADGDCGNFKHFIASSLFLIGDLCNLQ
jgi:hypothetical protein